MYPYPPPASATEDKEPRNPAANSTEPSMNNTSRVDVFASAAGGMSEFPGFMANAVPRAMHATLEPGDALLFPPGWWHAMRSEEKSFSVSMWY
jgi:ectoine hydroxylase-related dioxygenase (phytanoyl-CoA dioxygenase family)